jgi:rhodanese-related sulfurtransferase
MEISTQELDKLIHSSKKYILLDVREKSELPYGMIPTAKNVPFSEFESAEKMDEKVFEKKYGFAKFTKKDKIINYCHSGRRSNIATEYLNKKGYNAVNYKGSVREWSKIDKNVKDYG